jgi:DNA-binding HxlR family transcriptional regulator
MLGLRRFDEIQANLGIARNILHTRLRHLEDAGVIERRVYQEHPRRHEYRLTDKGLDLWPTIVSLMQWGDAHARPEAGIPVLLEHRGCGGSVDEHRTCRACGARLQVKDVHALAGPGAAPEHPLRVRESRRAGASAAASTSG